MTTKINVTRNIAEILKPYSEDLSRLEATLYDLATSHVSFVTEVAHYIIKNGGKRLRPLMTLMMAKIFGSPHEAVFNMGACMEFIHTASLLHDDVVDHATVRRGQKTANAHWGNSVSILVGDFFYCRASQLLTAEKDWEILKTVTDCITGLTEGEVLEIVTNQNQNDVTEAMYLDVIKYKTALLFDASCRVGALLMKANPEQVKACGDYGYHLGMAFQIMDDVLDYTSGAQSFGKSLGTDYYETKVTLPYMNAIRDASTEDQEKLKELFFAKEKSDESLQELIAKIKKYDGFEKSVLKAKEHIQKACQALDQLPEASEIESLFELAQFVVSRDY